MIKTIRVPYGNRFVVYIPAVWQDGTAIDAETIANLAVVLHCSNRSDYEATITAEDGRFVVSPADILPLGSYDIIVTATQAGREVALPINNAFAVTEWANNADFVRFIELDEQVLVGSEYSDEDIEELKETLQAKIEDYQAKIAEYEEKIAELEGVAQEATLTAGIATIEQAIDNIDLTEVAKETTLTNGVSTISAKIDNIDLSGVETAIDDAKDEVLAAMPSGYALQGANTSATNTAIYEAATATLPCVYDTDEAVADVEEAIAEILED